MRRLSRPHAAIATLLLAAAAFAGGWIDVPGQVARISAQAQWGARVVPDRILLTPAGDPAHSMAVTWRTDTRVLPGMAKAQITEADATPRYARMAATLPARTEAYETDLGPGHAHSVVFPYLKPDTLYAYRVGDGTHWSEWFQVRTASATPKPFSFVYFGDAQTELQSMWSQVIRRAYSQAPDVRLLVHAGDLINTRADTEWGEWHHAGGWINGMVPSLPAAGNHEYSKGTLNPYWRPGFTLPENGPTGLEETCYFVDWQGVRFVVLDTQQKLDEQAQWLDRVLVGHGARWTVLVFHRPIYSSAKGRDNKDLKEKWLPIIHKHKVDLVLQGHDHGYGRSSNLLNGMQAKSGEHGTVFVVSVSGPKMYDVEPLPWMRRKARNTQLFQIVTVDGGTLRYEARTATGELYDAFDLVRRGDGTNRMRERMDGKAERMEPLPPK